MAFDIYNCVLTLNSLCDLYSLILYLARAIFLLLLVHASIYMHLSELIHCRDTVSFMPTGPYWQFPRHRVSYT